MHSQYLTALDSEFVLVRYSALHYNFQSFILNYELDLSFRRVICYKFQLSSFTWVKSTQLNFWISNLPSELVGYVARHIALRNLQFEYLSMHWLKVVFLELSRDYLNLPFTNVIHNHHHFTTENLASFPLIRSMGSYPSRCVHYASKIHIMCRLVSCIICKNIQLWSMSGRCRKTSLN